MAGAQEDRRPMRSAIKVKNEIYIPNCLSNCRPLPYIDFF